MGEFKPSLTNTIPCVETKLAFFQATVLQITFYTLHTLIDKHVKNMKIGKIFPCFVGFKKAFDSIWHTGFYYELVESGVGGKVYSNNKCSVKIGRIRSLSIGYTYPKTSSKILDALKI